LLFVFDTGGIILESNKTAAEKLGYRPDELPGKSIFMLHPREMQDEAEKNLAEILAGKRSFCPLPLITKSGDLLDVETKISKGSWNGKSVLFSVCRDIREKRRAEETARKIEERYRILFENINDAVFVHEFTGKGLPGSFLEVNDMACERLGYTREELLRMSPKDIDAPEGYAVVPAMMKKLEKQKHNVWEGVHITKSGEKFPVEISNHLFEMDGKSVILATVRDISDRKKTEELLKRSEEKYRKIFENVQDIFYQADIEGRIVEISPSIVWYLSYKPEELIGKRADEVYMNPADRVEFLKILEQKGFIEDYLIKLKTRNNKEVLVSANVHKLYGPDGIQVGVEGSLRMYLTKLPPRRNWKQARSSFVSRMKNMQFLMTSLKGGINRYS
jgi:PAS domain S-box-containing protein